MSSLSFAVAGQRFDLEADREAFEALRDEVAAFLCPGTSEPVARLVCAPSDRQPDHPSTIPLLMPDGPTVGWAHVGAGKVIVYWKELSAVVAGLRLLMTRAFRPPSYLLVHGAALRWNGRALVAVGPSGAGKSTLCGLFHEAELLSDETVLLENKPCPVVHATPLRSSCPRPISAGSSEIAAVLALEKSAEPALRELGARQAVELLLAECFSHPEVGVLAQFEAAMAVVENVHRHTLSFRKDRSCIPLLTQLLAV